MIGWAVRYYVERNPSKLDRVVRILEKGERDAVMKRNKEPSALSVLLLHREFPDMFHAPHGDCARSLIGPLDSALQQLFLTEKDRTDESKPGVGEAPLIVPVAVRDALRRAYERNREQLPQRVREEDYIVVGFASSSEKCIAVNEKRFEQRPSGGRWETALNRSRYFRPLKRPIVEEDGLPDTRRSEWHAAPVGPFPASCWTTTFAPEHQHYFATLPPARQPPANDERLHVPLNAGAWSQTESRQWFAFIFGFPLRAAPPRWTKDDTRRWLEHIVDVAGSALMTGALGLEVGDEVRKLPWHRQLR